MSAATVTSKGQITIPADVREDFNIEQGHQMVFTRRLNGSLGVRIRKPRIGAGRGAVKLSYPLTMAEMEKAMVETILEEISTADSREILP